MTNKHNRSHYRRSSFLSQSCVTNTYSIGFSKVNIIKENITLSILGHVVFSRLESDRPVHQVQINIVQTQKFERLVQGSFNVFRTMAGVPQLCGDKEFFTRNTRILDGLANFVFVTVCFIICLLVDLHIK